MFYKTIVMHIENINMDIATLFLYDHMMQIIVAV